MNKVLGYVVLAIVSFIGAAAVASPMEGMWDVTKFFAALAFLLIAFYREPWDEDDQKLIRFPESLNKVSWRQLVALLFAVLMAAGFYNPKHNEAWSVVQVVVVILFVFSASRQWHTMVIETTPAAPPAPEAIPTAEEAAPPAPDGAGDGSSGPPA